MNYPDPVSTLLKQKGNHAFSISSDASVYSAIELMADKNVGGLLVIDDKKLVGIISERDYTRKVILKGKSSKDTFVREIMTPAPITVSVDTCIDEAMRIMNEKGIRHVPVVDAEGHVAGVLSMRDLLSWIVSAQAKDMEHVGMLLRRSIAVAEEF
jgi:CBS domain-containing protein